MHNEASTLELPAPEKLAAHAAELHDKGLNCAQCIACTFAPFVQADINTCFRATEGLNSGLGGFTETCGALLAGAFVLGLANSAGYENPTSKPETYTFVHELTEAFREETGATLCRDIKGAASPAPSSKCDACIERSVRLTAGILERMRA